jgi:2-polyprenyl-3-methyl-5-hydroxy-6-metoxy-1,4-benzoquinol methylase
VTAADISAAEVERAGREAQDRGVAIRFSVADMRQAAAHHREQFDLVIACDNAVPHLLTDETTSPLRSEHSRRAAASATA